MCRRAWRNNQINITIIIRNRQGDQTKTTALIWVRDEYTVEVANIKAICLSKTVGWFVGASTSSLRPGSGSALVRLTVSEDMYMHMTRMSDDLVKSRLHYSQDHPTHCGQRMQWKHFAVVSRFMTGTISHTQWPGLMRKTARESRKALH